MLSVSEVQNDVKNTYESGFTIHVYPQTSKVCTIFAAAVSHLTIQCANLCKNTNLAQVVQMTYIISVLSQIAQSATFCIKVSLIVLTL